MLKERVITIILDLKLPFDYTLNIFLLNDNKGNCKEEDRLNFVPWARSKLNSKRECSGRDGYFVLSFVTDPLQKGPIELL